MLKFIFNALLIVGLAGVGYIVWVLSQAGTGMIMGH